MHIKLTFCRFLSHNCLSLPKNALTLNIKHFSVILGHLMPIMMSSSSIKQPYKRYLYNTFLRRCCVMASMAVICARINADVYIMSTGILLILFPASIASSTPFLVSGTSTQPVNRFFSFHNDSPCLIRIRAASSEIHLETN